MRPVRSWAVRATLLVALALLCVSPPALAPISGTDSLPSRLSDTAFWSLVEDLSEPGGFFRSDNLISNEDTFQHVIPELQRRLPAGGVYIGVGPDQNFTYIEALEPQMAFVVDIRRENMILHLMYKAIIETSPDRADFLSRLFSRPRPEGLTATSTARELFDAFARVEPSRALHDGNLYEITRRLTADHHFRLSQGDRNSLAYIYGAFFEGGPDLRYSMPRAGFGGRFFPSYAELMMQSDAEGVQHGYLASEKNYRILRRYEDANLIVPLVGDFGGTKALRALASYLAGHGAIVRLFYTSNVEQYLFQSSAWRHFYSNLSLMPIDDSSTLLRSHFNMGFRYPLPLFGSPVWGARSAMLVDPIPTLLEDVGNGRVRGYDDVVDRSR